jgi:hypothetical protein
LRARKRNGPSDDHRGTTPKTRRLFIATNGCIEIGIGHRHFYTGAFDGLPNPAVL